jgi:hypothetical protein
LHRSSKEQCSSLGSATSATQSILLEGHDLIHV